MLDYREDRHRPPQLSESASAPSLHEFRFPPSPAPAAPLTQAKSSTSASIPFVASAEQRPASLPYVRLPDASVNSTSPSDVTSKNVSFRNEASERSRHLPAPTSRRPTMPFCTDPPASSPLSNMEQIKLLASQTGSASSLNVSRIAPSCRNIDESAVSVPSARCAAGSSTSPWEKLQMDTSADVTYAEKVFHAKRVLHDFQLYHAHQQEQQLQKHGLSRLLAGNYSNNSSSSGAGGAATRHVVSSLSSAARAGAGDENSQQDSWLTSYEVTAMPVDGARKLASSSAFKPRCGSPAAAATKPAFAHPSLSSNSRGAEGLAEFNTAAFAMAQHRARQLLYFNAKARSSFSLQGLQLTRSVYKELLRSPAQDASQATPPPHRSSSNMKTADGEAISPTTFTPVAVTPAATPTGSIEGGMRATETDVSTTNTKTGAHASAALCTSVPQGSSLRSGAAAHLEHATMYSEAHCGDNLKPPAASMNVAESERALALLCGIRAMRRQTEDLTVALLHACGEWACWSDAASTSHNANFSAAGASSAEAKTTARQHLFADLFLFFSNASASAANTQEETRVAETGGFTSRGDQSGAAAVFYEEEMRQRRVRACAALRDKLRLPSRESTEFTSAAAPPAPAVAFLELAEAVPRRAVPPPPPTGVQLALFAAQHHNANLHTLQRWEGHRQHHEQQHPLQPHHRFQLQLQRLQEERRAAQHTYDALRTTADAAVAEQATAQAATSPSPTQKTTAHSNTRNSELGGSKAKTTPHLQTKIEPSTQTSPHVSSPDLLPTPTKEQPTLDTFLTSPPELAVEQTRPWLDSVDGPATISGATAAQRASSHPPQHVAATITAAASEAKAAAAAASDSPILPTKRVVRETLQLPPATALLASSPIDESASLKRNTLPAAKAKVYAAAAAAAARLLSSSSSSALPEEAKPCTDAAGQRPRKALTLPAVMVQTLPSVSVAESMESVPDGVKNTCSPAPAVEKEMSETSSQEETTQDDDSEVLVLRATNTARNIAKAVSSTSSPLAAAEAADTTKATATTMITAEVERERGGANQQKATGDVEKSVQDFLSGLAAFNRQQEKQQQQQQEEEEEAEGEDVEADVDVVEGNPSEEKSSSESKIEDGNVPDKAKVAGDARGAAVKESTLTDVSYSADGSASYSYSYTTSRASSSSISSSVDNARGRRDRADGDADAIREGRTNAAVVAPAECAASWHPYLNAALSTHADAAKVAADAAAPPQVPSKRSIKPSTERNAQRPRETPDSSGVSAGMDAGVYDALTQWLSAHEKKSGASTKRDDASQFFSLDELRTISTWLHDTQQRKKNDSATSVSSSTPQPTPAPASASPLPAAVQKALRLVVPGFTPPPTAETAPPSKKADRTAAPLSSSSSSQPLPTLSPATISAAAADRKRGSSTVISPLSADEQQDNSCEEKEEGVSAAATQSRQQPSSPAEEEEQHGGGDEESILTSSLSHATPALAKSEDPQSQQPQQEQQEQATSTLRQRPPLHPQLQTEQRDDDQRPADVSVSGEAAGEEHAPSPRKISFFTRVFRCGGGRQGVIEKRKKDKGGNAQ